MMVVNKSNAVRELVLIGNYKKALSIVRGFRLGISKKDSSKMALAYECMVRPVFYEQLGTDTATAITEGIQTLVSIYGQDT